MIRINKLRISLRWDTFRCLMICIYSALIFTPYVTSYYMNIPFFVALLILFMTILDLLKVLNHKLIFASFALLFIELIYRIIGLSDASIGNYGLRIMTFISLWIGYFSWNNLSFNECKCIVNVSLLTLVINTIDNIRLYRLYPNIIPTLRGTEYFYNQWGKVNIGDTGFKYQVFFMSLFLLLYIWKDEKFRHHHAALKLLYFVAWVILTLFTIVYCASGTIILSLIIGTILIVALGANNPKKTIIRLALLVMLFGILFVFSYQILSLAALMAEQISGSKVARRIVAISNLLNNSMNAEDIMIFERVDFLLLDLNSWLRNPLTFIFGVGYHTRVFALNVNEAATLNGDGNHSGIFDLVARYGLLAVGVLLPIINGIKRYLCVGYLHKQHVYVSIIFGLLVFNCIFNNLITLGMAFIVFMCYPYFTNNIGSINN